MKILAPGYLLRDDGVIEIDADVVYPDLMNRLRIDRARLDQYWLSVMLQCAKLEAIRLIAGTEHDKRRQGISLQLHIRRGADKRQWQIKCHTPGRGVDMGLKHARARFAHLHGETEK